MCDFYNLPAKERLMYQELWKNKEHVENLLDCKISPRISRNKPNSFFFGGDTDTAELFKSIFGIKNEEIFDIKYDMATGGDGDEGRKIRTLHSSSLCALLFFYNVTSEHPLTLNLDGRIIKFTRSAFEFKSPVIRNASNMDIVLFGKEENTEKAVVFLLESKFSEHYMSADSKLNGISSNYINNPYSSPFYKKQFLSRLSLKTEPKDIEDIEDIKDIKEFNLLIDTEDKEVSTDNQYYIGGIKQMISHYVGMRKLDKNKFYGGKKSEYHISIEKAIKNGADIILGEILFGDDVEAMKPATERYSEKYKLLAEKMNQVLEAEGRTRLHVLKEDLSYSKLFKDKSYSVEEEIWKYYFGRGV